MIHVIATITTKPGRRDEVLRAFLANVPAVHAEPGCIEYVATVDSAPALKFQTPLAPDTFIVVEKWESTAALEPHLATPHMESYRAKVGDLIAHRTIHVLSAA
jgi:quinol monooxygenase YgiN